MCRFATLVVLGCLQSSWSHSAPSAPLGAVRAEHDGAAHAGVRRVPWAGGPRYQPGVLPSYRGQARRLPVQPTAELQGRATEVRSHEPPCAADVSAIVEKKVSRGSSDVLARGGKIYEQHCASCHGGEGQGVPFIYPPLAGNRAVLLDPPNNLVQIIRLGGFFPTTAGNPQPFGMPPFRQVLNEEDIAAVTTYVRQSWGNSAPAVSTFDVHRVR